MEDVKIISRSLVETPQIKSGMNLEPILRTRMIAIYSVKASIIIQIQEFVKTVIYLWKKAKNVQLILIALLIKLESLLSDHEDGAALVRSTETS